ncbi:DNA-directed RNA polymerase subunit H [Candidatus Woesearchaeota archaeon]|mgnify:CR=1 FL=1|jgi:DNA-directed RNA polymerase subunit H|nr:DNA-directed RNA polymerase subunit H [Candidatus Woesearchaeota archaeon]MBT5272892.1 DNA-directed RNA polymerase subunit H [Candidatus Woesearchaeota archaeon]MBT6041358.1 DNA-directed RNA polymerase subunit H [Candidatus Woesearchaeota archaeon]MBT6337241.1 DNA-directed RNA polymerase subunit H [Candidatus Woesearchaeota archaeon]MBT7927118.1 DNA-directed RNA polymerase subunit H [Candidatus Woesearchaeota archaeon]
MATTKFDVTKHIFVPKHIIISDREKNQLFKTYSITLRELPKIYSNDPAIKHLKTKAGDVVKIVRKSPTAGETVYYRGVINA